MIIWTRPFFFSIQCLSFFFWFECGVANRYIFQTGLATYSRGFDLPLHLLILHFHSVLFFKQNGVRVKFEYRGEKRSVWQLFNVMCYIY